MKISKQQLIEAGACEEGLQRFLAATDYTEKPVDVLSLRGKGMLTCDVAWFLAQFIPTVRLINFCREVLSPIYENGLFMKPFDEELAIKCSQHEPGIAKGMCKLALTRAVYADRAKTAEAVYKLLGEYE